MKINKKYITEKINYSNNYENNRNNNLIMRLYKEICLKYELFLQKGNNFIKFSYKNNLTKKMKKICKDYSVDIIFLEKSESIENSLKNIKKKNFFIFKMQNNTTSPLKVLYQHLRNSIAHGRFDIINKNNRNLRIIFQDIKKINKKEQITMFGSFESSKKFFNFLNEIIKK